MAFFWLVMGIAGTLVILWALAVLAIMIPAFISELRHPTVFWFEQER